MRHRRRTFCAIRTFSRKRQRNGPLEDCGGISGFYELLEPIAERAHPGHVHAKEWAGDYDPDTFDDLPIKYALARIANRRNAAKSTPRQEKSAWLGCLIVAFAGWSRRGQRS